MLDLCRKILLLQHLLIEKSLCYRWGSPLLQRCSRQLWCFSGIHYDNNIEALISIVCSERVFSRATGYIAISGTILLMIYLVLVTFMPAARKSAMNFFASTGGDPVNKSG